MNYLFLYTELAGYTILCMKKHLELNPNDQIHVVHYPVNKEAPFEFNNIPNLYLYNKQNTSFEKLYELFKDINPKLIICSGWIDEIYLKLVKLIYKDNSIILAFDNIYKGTLRQKVLLPFGKIYLKKFFKAAWVPGEQQKMYGKKMGFAEEKIHTGFYATDTEFFENAYLESKKEKENSFPKIFLCTARYVPQKGLPYMWKAFIELQKELNNTWELWNVGTGIEFEDRIIHEKIKHLGFIQPKDLVPLVKKTGIFILPSISEPWGVAVHEFAAAGMPLCLSINVGSGNAFLQENVNGFSFEPRNIDSIKNSMKKFMTLGDEQLNIMGKASFTLAQKINAKKWSETLTLMANIYNY